MKPLDWLRRQAKPMTPEQETIFLQICEAVDANIRDARLALAQLAPPREPFTMPSATRPRIPASERVPSWSSRCDCWPQYIDCCCDVRKHAQRQ